MRKKARIAHPRLPLIVVPASPTEDDTETNVHISKISIDPFAAYLSDDEFRSLSLHHRNYLLYENVLFQVKLTGSVSNMQYILSVCEMVHSFIEPVYQRVYCLVQARYHANIDFFTVSGLMAAILGQFDSICAQTCSVHGCYAAITARSLSGDDHIVAAHFVEYTGQWNTIVQSWLALFQMIKLMVDHSVKCLQFLSAPEL
jgi:hypothetical protein